MRCFRIDESGYTGFDLLNLDQCFQGATAIAIGPGEPRQADRLTLELFAELSSLCHDTPPASG